MAVVMANVLFVTSSTISVDLFFELPELGLQHSLALEKTMRRNNPSASQAAETRRVDVVWTASADILV